MTPETETQLTQAELGMQNRVRAILDMPDPPSNHFWIANPSNGSRQPLSDEGCRQVEAFKAKHGRLPQGVRAWDEPEIDWRDLFRRTGELEEGDVRMLISNFLPEGLTFIGGLAGEGKTLLALSIVKALVTGRNFLGREDFNVPQRVPVLYLIPESSARAFRKRCEKFRIPDTKNFLCRTISEGATLRLDDPILLEAVKDMKPVLCLDTVIRFSQANDENAAAQNKKLVDDIIRLRQAGAISVVGLHHSTKAMREAGMSLETVLRGTGDLAAACDAVYGLMRDSTLYDHGNGPNEIDIECVKPRDFDPPLPFRVAATRKAPGDAIGTAKGVVSVIDETGDLQISLNSPTQRKRDAQRAQDDQLSGLVSKDPGITLEGLAESTGLSQSTINRTLKRLGWHKPKGQGQNWTKCQTEAINLDQ